MYEVNIALASSSRPVWAAFQWRTLDGHMSLFPPCVDSPRGNKTPVCPLGVKSEPVLLGGVLWAWGDQADLNAIPVGGCCHVAWESWCWANRNMLPVLRCMKHGPVLGGWLRGSVLSGKYAYIRKLENKWKMAFTGLFIVLSLETEQRTLHNYSRLQNESSPEMFKISLWLLSLFVNFVSSLL